MTQKTFAHDAHVYELSTRRADTLINQITKEVEAAQATTTAPPLPPAQPGVTNFLTQLEKAYTARTEATAALSKDLLSALTTTEQAIQDTIATEAELASSFNELLTA